MIFPVLTLVTSLLLAAVAGWFSITGMVTILAGQALAALVLGITLEAGKLVTISWLYRNWEYASWKLKIPLIYFTVALMSITSMGVYGYLAQAHIQQGASTVNNAARVEQLNAQIAREQSLIADNDRVIAQLDSSVNNLISRDRTDRALVIKRSQDSQRKQLKADSERIQGKINTLSDEKFQLESQLRSLELEVGPIRYIAELVYGAGSDSRTLEAAVRMFAILIVTTLDPLAITLLIAANQSLMRLREYSEITPIQPPSHISEPDRETTSEPDPATATVTTEPMWKYTVTHTDHVEPQAHAEWRYDYEYTEPEQSDTRWMALYEPMHMPDDVEWSYEYELPGSVTMGDHGQDAHEITDEYEFQHELVYEAITPEQDWGDDAYAQDEPQQEPASQFVDEDFGLSRLIRELSPDEDVVDMPWLAQTDSLRELIGDAPHFVAKRIIDPVADTEEDKYPKPLSWLTEFKRIT